MEGRKQEIHFTPEMVISSLFGLHSLNSKDVNPSVDKLFSFVMKRIDYLVDARDSSLTVGWAGRMVFALNWLDLP